MNNLFLSINSTIEQALKVIDSSSLKLGIIVDDASKLIGVISDGDIRRALLSGINLNQKITKFINRNPIVCNLNESKDNLIQIAIKNKIYAIPIIDNDNNLVKIEKFEDLLSQKSHPNKVVIMAGGKGERLYPLTKKVPKPLIRIGKKPILQLIIENFVKDGYNNFFISVNYRSNMIKNFFKDGRSFGAKIVYLEESKKLGTAGSLGLIGEKIDKPLIVVNADVLTTINYENMVNYHELNNSSMTVGIREYLNKIPFGVVNVKNEKVSSIVEKPINRYLVNSGIYILDPKILNYIKINESLDMPSLINKCLKDKLKISPYHIREYWRDIGQHEELRLANDEFSEYFY